MSDAELLCARHHSGAKGLARLVLLEYAGYRNASGPAGVWARTQTIADGCGISRRSVQHAKAELRKAGHIEIEEQAGQGGTDRVRVVLCPSCAARAHKDPEPPLSAHLVHPPSGAPGAQGGAHEVRPRGSLDEGALKGSPTHPEDVQPRPCAPPALNSKSSLNERNAQTRLHPAGGLDPGEARRLDHGQGRRDPQRRRRRRPRHRRPARRRLPREDHHRGADAGTCAAPVRRDPTGLPGLRG
jgi:hypothetical protein